MTQIADIDGIRPAYRDKLVAARVKTTEALLDRAAKSNRRRDLAAATGSSANLDREKKLVRRVPTLAEVERQVAEVAVDFASEHAPELIAQCAPEPFKSLAAGGGAGQGG